MKSIDDPMMCRKEATEYLGLHPGTLEAWASRGSVNVPMIRLGRAVRYRKSDLDRFIESNRATATGKRS